MQTSINIEISHLISEEYNLRRPIVNSKLTILVHFLNFLSLARNTFTFNRKKYLKLNINVQFKIKILNFVMKRFDNVAFGKTLIINQRKAEKLYNFVTKIKTWYNYRPINILHKTTHIFN